MPSTAPSETVAPRLEAAAASPTFVEDAGRGELHGARGSRRGYRKGEMRRWCGLQFERLLEFRIDGSFEASRQWQSGARRGWIVVEL